jgi:hypothetical protein
MRIDCGRDLPSLALAAVAALVPWGQAPALGGAPDAAGQTRSQGDA